MEVVGEVVHDQIQILLIEVVSEELVDDMHHTGVLELGDYIQLPVPILLLLQGDLEG